MSKILLLSYTFPPRMQAQGFQVAKIAKALGRLNHSITIITWDDGHQRRIEGDCSVIMPKNAKLHYVKNLGQLLPQSFLVQLIVNRSLRLIGYPNEFMWLWPAIRKSRELLKSEKYDLIYSRGNPPVSNVLGLMAKKQSHLPWIAHFSDPWLHNPLNPMVGRMRKICTRYNDQIHKCADLIYYTCVETVDFLQSRVTDFPIRKVRILPQGYDPDEYASNDNCGKHGGELAFVYTGMFYRKRSPEYFIRALEVLDSTRTLTGRLKVVFVGPVDPKIVERCNTFVKNGVIQFAGVRSRQATHEYCMKADVLLLIDSTEEDATIFSPSKLIDYLPYKKYILALTQKQSAAARILRTVGMESVEPADTASIARAVDNILNRKVECVTAVVEYEQQIKPYAIDQIAGLLNEEIERLTCS